MANSDPKKRHLQEPWDATAARILESITDAFFALDPEWRFTYLNSQAERLLARTRADLIGRNVWDEFPLAVGAAFYHQYHRAMAEGIAVSFEEYYPPPLDTWFEVRAYPSEDGLSVYFHDISARKRAEDAREMALMQLQAVQDSTQDGIIVSDPVGNLLLWNPASLAIHGLPSLAEAQRHLDEFRNRFILMDANGAIIPHEDWPLSRLIRGEPFTDHEVRLCLLDTGEERWVSYGGSQAFAPDGRLLLLVLTVRDVTERKRAERELAEAYRREALINEISAAIRNAPDARAVQRLVVEALGQALRADRCYYVTYDAAWGVGTIPCDWCRADLPSIAGDYRLSDFAMNGDTAYRAGRTQALDDTQTLSPANQAPLSAIMLERLGLRALIRTPLAAGPTQAALAVAMADEPRAWTRSEVTLVETIAAQTLAAVEALRVRDREHKIAMELQGALQPAIPQKVPGLDLFALTRPALEEAEVGGDFFDVFPLDKGLYALVIGDVSGKGLAAAAQLATVRNMLRATLYQHLAPAEAVTSLNAILTDHNLLLGFVTALVGVYDAATGCIRYASCGHEPGLVRRASGRVEELETTGTPLGAAENVFYSEKSITLSDGDALLLYTDGLSEAGPSRRELLGTEGLARLLEQRELSANVEAYAHELVADVAAYARGIFRDDICILLLRRQLAV